MADDCRCAASVKCHLVELKAAPCVMYVKPMSDEQQNRPTFVGVVVNNHRGNINKICCLIYEKSADKIVEDRTCLLYTSDAADE